MPKSQTKIDQPVAHIESVDDVEAAFYDAMRLADVDKLMAVWSDEVEIACVHPGGLRLVGTEAIRAAFEAVFSSGSIQVSIVNVQRITSTGVAIHHVLEKVHLLNAEGMHTAYILASNVYLQSAQGWRMVLHHASPGQLGDAQHLTETTHLLH